MNNTLEKTLRTHLSNESFNLVVNETERQEKGRWALYKDTRCETLKMALCYLLDPNKIPVGQREFFNKLFNL